MALNRSGHRVKGVRVLAEAIMESLGRRPFGEEERFAAVLRRRDLRAAVRGRGPRT